MSARRQVRVGDIFGISLGGDGSIYGQVVAEWGMGHFYLVVFSRAYGQEETPSVEEILSDEIALIALVLDAKLWNGEWPVVGWAPADADAVPFPAYLEGTDVVDWTGRLRRPATNEELQRLQYREVYSPAAFEKVVSALRGSGTWSEAWSYLRVPPSDVQSRMVFGPLTEEGPPDPHAPAPAVDAAVLAELQRRGVDLGEPREVHHFLYFGTKGSAAKAQTALQARGFAVDVKRSGGEWLVTASNEARVTSEFVADVRSNMERLAAALGGEYDGWEAAVSEQDGQR